MSLLYWIFLLIDSVVYNFINYAYQIFLLLSRVVLANEQIISPFIKRVYTIIGVVMLFIIAYSFLKAVVNPENNVKSMGQTVFGIVKAIILLALVPPMFDFAYTVQDSILNQNTIGRIILGGGSSGTSPADVINNGGFELSRTMLKAFIFPKSGKAESDVTVEGDTSYTLDEIWGAMESNKTFRYLTLLSEELGLDDSSEIDYQVIISTGAACYILYLLISYCLSLGLRVIKLLFYEVIAPIPILASILPNKKEMFNKWLSVTLTTFIEVFLRVGIMYLTVYIASLVPNIELIQKQNGPVGFLANACILMGLFSFVKKAPELIAEVTGIDSNKMGTGIKEQLKNGGFFAAGGALGAGATALTRRGLSAIKTGHKKRKEYSAEYKKEGATKADKRKAAWGMAKTIAGTAAGMTFGAASSAIRGGAKGFSTEASSFKDVRDNASKGAIAEGERVGKKARYRASHGGFIGSIGGRITDAAHAVGDWATGGAQQYEEKEKEAQAMQSKAKNTFEAAKTFVKKFGSGKTTQKLVGDMVNIDSAVYDDEGNIIDIKDTKFKGATKAEKVQVSLAAREFASRNMSIEDIRESIEKERSIDVSANIQKSSFVNQESYAAAQKAAMDAVNRGDYSDDIKYEMALKNAAASVSIDSHIDVESYNKAIEKAKAEQSQKITVYSKVLTQLEDESAIQVVNAVGDGSKKDTVALASLGISGDNLGKTADIEAAAKQVIDAFQRAGGSVAQTVTKYDDSGHVISTEQKVISSATFDKGFGSALDDMNKAYKNVENENAAKAEEVRARSNKDNK